MFSPNHLNCVNPELLSRIRNNKDLNKHIQLRIHYSNNLVCDFLNIHYLYIK